MKPLVLIGARCDSPTCWCHRLPRERQIVSLGIYYTVRETSDGTYVYSHIQEDTAK